ncbi:single-stranded DNA-binding protein [Actinomyces sp. B33]|uniref:Jag family protein n=1 Tax=Actinomyces sp. B33 TaxID=2942131 RepID=UPI00233F9D31|nr:R3H domain-containing nucleic acid-binding protein [Actinomyces sp. B33]MDC4232540.1 single-stranded DNA-binding protein [Actinomyces sp. B33]
MSEDTKAKLTRLEEEGEFAADYLEELLDIADLGGDIEIDVENGRASVEIVSEDEGGLDRLVGDDGEVLDALQELTRLAVQTETGERSRLMLDIAGFRAERKEELQELTLEAIARLRATGEEQKLEPMNPFERKVCHDVVAAEGLFSESKGAEPHRRVVILVSEGSGEAVADAAAEAAEASEDGVED